jgi:hypothetical protein
MTAREREQPNASQRDGPACAAQSMHAAAFRPVGLEELQKARTACAAGHLPVWTNAQQHAVGERLGAIGTGDMGLRTCIRIVRAVDEGNELASFKDS